MQKSFAEYILKVLEIVYRRRPVGAILLVGGLTLLGAVNVLFAIDLQQAGGKVSLRIGTGDIPSQWVDRINCVAIALIVIGAILLVYQYVTDVRTLRRKIVLALELRGLVDTSDVPLKDAVPSQLPGMRKEILVDVRDHMRSKTLQEVCAALDEVNLIGTRLSSEMKGRDRSDVSLVVGGLLPVPFLFLVGMALDDEGGMTLMDWKRHERRWSELSGADDDSRFEVHGLDQRLSSDQVVLVISASYLVNTEEVKATFSGLPVVELKLLHPVPDKLWSEVQQMALARQFLDVAATLAGQGTKQLHVVLAAPSSLALRFGQSYDRRNLPNAIVYQYERTSVPPYPWGVSMPTHGIVKAAIVTS